MKASEGKLGRVFMLRLDEGEKAAEEIERFAVEKEIAVAQIFTASGGGVTGILAPDAEGRPGLRLAGGAAAALAAGEIILQEVTGIHFRRVKDPASGKETLRQFAATKTQVMTRPAPAPEEAGPGCVPVYLFNAEFN